MVTTIATQNANAKPPINTTNTPPTLSIFNAVTDDDDFFASSIHCPPPFFCFHHFSFNSNKRPDSCNFRIASDNRLRYFDPKLR
ncbi:hypothetical protein DERP_004040 [Dermatophagoides pteronyssinus]|uniref:Uncharacterized protein n=1 Tax=Dermatophagoides pteronyssinus TaxID=6956 RepID=A0ABQ8J7Z4_DERPT|nr:hypothetical protein DERP_004040 [Dermatophagoides pteronyssinus]